MSEYKEEDVVLVGWKSDNPPEVPSTRVNCHKCGQEVWVSHGSMNAVLDEKVKTGGELYITCLMCSPSANDPNHEMQVGEEQKAEMLAQGFDFDEWLRKSGLTMTQLSQMIVQKAKFMEELRKLHRDANPGGCGSPTCSVCRKEQS